MLKMGDGFQSGQDAKATLTLDIFMSQTMDKLQSFFKVTLLS